MIKFGEPFTALDDIEVLEELERLILDFNPVTPVIFRGNHASNVYSFGGTIPQDKEKLLSLISELKPPPRNAKTKDFTKILVRFSLQSKIIIGGILVIIGIAYLVMAYRLWNGRRWVWKLTLILSGLGIIVGIVSVVVGNVGPLFHSIINAVVIYYLYRPKSRIILEDECVSRNY